MFSINKRKMKSDLSCNQNGYTIQGAARAIATSYNIPESAIIRYLEKVFYDSIMIDEYGFPVNKSEADIYNCRISVSDLNENFLHNDIPYHLTNPYEAINKENQENPDVVETKKNIYVDDIRAKIIIAVLNEMQFDNMNIPRGGKLKIMLECLKCKDNFASEWIFERAWSYGVKYKLFRAADHDKHSSKIK